MHRRQNQTENFSSFSRKELNLHNPKYLSYELSGLDKLLFELEDPRAKVRGWTKSRDSAFSHSLMEGHDSCLESSGEEISTREPMFKPSKRRQRTWDLSHLVGRLVQICDPEDIRQPCSLCQDSEMADHLHMSSDGNIVVDPKDKFHLLEDSPVSCENCGDTSGNLFRCSSICASFYCSATCQLDHRFLHRTSCKGSGEDCWN